MMRRRHISSNDGRRRRRLSLPWWSGAALLLGIYLMLQAGQGVADADRRVAEKARSAMDSGTAGSGTAGSGSTAPDSTAPGTTASGSEGAEPGDCLRVHYIDVGQGDATLLQYGDAAMLIDAGDESKGTAVQYYLREQGVERLDYLVLTHPDADHIGGAAVIVTKFDTDTVWMADCEKESRTYEKLLDALAYRGMEWETPAAGETYELGEARVTVLGPLEHYEESNNNSLILRVQYGDRSFLFAGDAESEAELALLESGADLQADVYMAAHHGSRDASAEEFLDAVKPQAAVISCGADNDYGHPHREVLERLQKRDIAVYRTDELGSILAVTDGRKIWWEY